MTAATDVPADLKQIVPYLQRANELKNKDDVVAYWCTFYAAKVGIDLKVRSNEGRTFLMRLMDTLEKMKQELDESDALGDITGRAYVENFALRVFEAADAEDRAGRVTKGTAMKFVAAACFLEVLNVFETVDPEFIEKTKYAKWRAGQIGKAFREGRKPAPPPGVHIPQDLDSDVQFPGDMTQAQAHSTSSVKIHSPSPRVAPSLPDSPPTGTSAEIDLLRTPTGHSPQRLAPEERSITPGMWSTVATPGLDDHYAIQPGHPAAGSPSPTDFSAPAMAPHSSGLLSDRGEPDEDAWSTLGNNPMSRQNSWSTTAYDEDSTRPSTSSSPSTPPAPPPSTASPPPNHIQKHVRFTPSVVGGSEASTSPPQSLVNLPNAHAPSSPPASSPGVLKTIPGPPPILPSAPPAPPPQSHSRLPSSPTFISHSPSNSASAPAAPYAGPSKAVPVMTPKFIATVQKHCKFAISALDYEDAETARKELRAALAMLGD